MTYNVLDLFCGAGGLSHGFSKSPEFQVVAGIDNCQVAIDTFNLNENGVGRCLDLTATPPESLDIGDVDVIVGGIPCPSFSMAGRRDAADPRDDLFRSFVRYVDYFKPKVFLAENVVGILSKKDPDGVKVVDKILVAFDEIGYAVSVFKVNASFYHVPQRRVRVFFVGTRAVERSSSKRPSHSPKIRCRAVQCSTTKRLMRNSS
jgi:DNA (cytosine-5)-methyltransferase 1